MTTVEQPGKNVSQQEEEEVEERQRHDSAEVDGTQSIFIRYKAKQHDDLYLTFLLLYVRVSRDNVISSRCNCYN